MKKFGKRFYKALEQSIEFFGAKAIVVGCLPLIFWLLKRFVKGDKTVGDIGLLVLSCSIVAICVFVWKFIKANSALREEEQFEATIGALSAEERFGLAAFTLRLPHRGDLTDQVAAKAPFIARAFSGPILAEEHTVAVREWAKKFNPNKGKAL